MAFPGGCPLQDVQGVERKCVSSGGRQGLVPHAATFELCALRWSPSASFHFLVRETGMGRSHEVWLVGG